jgi:hypothetical protein
VDVERCRESPKVFKLRSQDDSNVQVLVKSFLGKFQTALHDALLFPFNINESDTLVNPIKMNGSDSLILNGIKRASSNDV